MACVGDMLIDGAIKGSGYMTKESCRQILVGRNLGATSRVSTTVLDIRPQTVDPLPIIPHESFWVGTSPRCSVPEPRPAARMWENIQEVLARPDHAHLPQKAPPRRATAQCACGMEPKRSRRRGRAAC
jgi:hypothetical protein